MSFTCNVLLLLNVNACDAQDCDVPYAVMRTCKLAEFGGMGASALASANQLINQSVSESVGQSTNQSAYLPVNQSINQTVHQLNQFIYQHLWCLRTPDLMGEQNISNKFQVCAVTDT